MWQSYEDKPLHTYFLRKTSSEIFRARLHIFYSFFLHSMVGRAKTLCIPLSKYYALLHGETHRRVLFFYRNRTRYHS